MRDTRTAVKPEPSEIDLVGGVRERITLRAVILSLILIVINDYWIVQLEVVRYSYPTYAAPFYNVIFTLLVLTGVNALVRRRSPRTALTRTELITVYVMVSIASGVCSHEMQAILVSMMGHAAFFKTPENGWGPLFADGLPGWLTVSDRASLRNFYFGGSSLYSYDNYAPWIVPVICWSAFGMALLYTMLCLNAILRKQWIESERLTFPIVMLPLEMTQESGALFRNRHMWLGFAIAGSITLVAGIHYLVPSVPYIRIVRTNVGQYLTTPPWNAMGMISVGFYFWAIGLAFLMPLELSASCWLFYWLYKLQLVACSMTGINQLAVTGGAFDRGYPFALAQSYGAYIGFFVMSMWSSRRYLGRVFRTAFMGTKEEDESHEPMRYRAAIVGAVGGFVFLTLFGRAMGMSPLVAVIFFVLYFVVAVIVSRIRAELGFPTHDAYIMGPHRVILTAAGVERLTTADVSSFGLLTWISRDYSSSPSPHMMESLKMSEQAGGMARQMYKAVMIAGAVAMPIGFWMLLDSYYHYGGASSKMEMWATGFGKECWGTVESWLKQPLGPNGTAMGFVGVGFAISMLLGWARLRFTSFPLHPLAFAMASNWGVGQLWMPLLIGSTAKLIILKFGGLRSYRTAIPFFMGLILGEITIGSLWTIVGVVLGIPTYDFWPGKYV